MIGFFFFLLIAITDLKKERARNLLPAYVGVYGIIIFLINTIMINLAHGPAMVIHLGVNVSAALLVSLQEMDSNERALMVAGAQFFAKKHRTTPDPAI